MIETKVRRIGSSLGVILPKKSLDQAGIKEGDVVVIPRLAPNSPRDLYGIWRDRPVRLEFDSG